MFKKMFPPIENESNQSPQDPGYINIQRAFWVSIVFTAVAVISMGLGIYLVFNYPYWQIYAILIFATLSVVFDVLATILIKRGRAATGLQILYWSFIVVLPANNFLVPGVGPVLAAMALVVGFVNIFLLFPHAWRKFTPAGPIVAALLILLVEYLNPPFRYSIGTLPTAGFFGPFILAFLVVGILFLIIRQAWGGNIRVKLVTSFTVIALISVAIVGTVVYISYRNQVREDIRQRLLNIVTITAIRLDGDLHATLQTPEDMQTEAYRQMMAEGDEIIATDPDLIFSYTMRMNEQGQIYFVIDSRRADDTERDAIGTIYDEPSETLQAFFNAPDRPIVEEEIYTDKYGSVLSAFAPFYRADGSLEGIFGIDIAADVVLEQERNVLYLILGTTLGTMLLVTLLGLFLGNLYVGPIVSLAQVTQKVTAGDLNARAAVKSKDEVGDLARAFNTMTAQLQGTLQGLEQRVAERTQSLELAADVGRSVSQVRALDVMLKDAAEIIRSRFDLYYTQVYLTNPGQTELVLQAGTGTVGAELLGRSHRLLLNTGSINGRAAVEKHSVVIADTISSVTFRPNPLLPDTRSEMAVPLIVGEKVVGVLDLQSRTAGALSEGLLPAFEALAGQLAIAIQNASLLAEAEQARAEVETQARRLVRANWSDYLDAIHKPEHTGFMFEQDQVKPMDAASEVPAGNALHAPIAVTGEAIGSLVVELDADKQTAQNVELVSTIARQVAQQVENLRLLESAERYRFEAEQAVHRVTREGWKTYMESGSGKFGYMYDLKEVLPVEPDYKASDNAVSLPINVRDEAVGKIALTGVDQNDGQSLELANAVAERLGAHIESLRQFDQTQSALAQTEKLSAASLRFAQATDLQEVVKIAVETLNIAKINRAVLGVFTYNSANELESMEVAANWWNGSGHPVTSIGTRYMADTLRVLSMFVSPTPVFATDTFDDPRVDAAGLEVVKRANIRSMAALPLYLGSRQVGTLLLEAEEPHTFTENETKLFSAMGPQIATVLENRRQYAQAQKQAERESTLNVISQKIQSATTVEAVLQIAARELGHALGAPLTIAQLGIQDKK